MYLIQWEFIFFSIIWTVRLSVNIFYNDSPHFDFLLIYSCGFAWSPCRHVNSVNLNVVHCMQVGRSWSCTRQQIPKCVQFRKNESFKKRKKINVHFNAQWDSGIHTYFQRPDLRLNFVRTRSAFISERTAANVSNHFHCRCWTIISLQCHRGQFFPLHVFFFQTRWPTHFLSPLSSQIFVWCRRPQPLSLFLSPISLQWLVCIKLSSRASDGSLAPPTSSPHFVILLLFSRSTAAAASTSEEAGLD